MKIGNRIAVMSLVAILTFTNGIVAFANEVSLNLNGMTSEFKSEPINENGHLLADGEEIAEMLGATSEWNESTKTLTISKGENTAEFKDGNTKYYLNGSPKYLENKARMVDEKLFIPISEVCKIFGATVRWNSKTSTVSIDTGEDFATDVKTVEPIINENTVTYTYDKALSDAMSYNSDLKNLSDNVSLMEQQRKETIADYENMAYIEGMPMQDYTTINYMRGLKATDENINNIQYQKEMIKTQTEYMLISTLNNISIYEVDIQLLKDAIALQQQNLNNVSLKESVGMASDNDVRDAKQALEESKSNLNTLEIGLKSLKSNLNKICGYPPTQDTYIKYSPKMETVDVDIDAYTTSKTFESPSIKILENNLEQAQYVMNTSVETVQNTNTGNSETDATDKVKAETNLNAATRALNDATDSMEQSIYRAYNDLKTMEEKQKTLEIEMEKAKNDYNTAKVSLQAGVVTQYEVDLAAAQMEKIEADMLKNIYNYDTLMFAFENPFLLGAASI